LFDYSIIDRKGEGECWGSVRGEELLGEVRDFNDLANVLYDANFGFVEHERR
jgi:hypothetical protein